MREGPNLLKLARKEQCLALGNRLRSKYKIAYQFYRVFPNGEVQYLHPKDGVYPEKVNAGSSPARTPSTSNLVRRICVRASSSTGSYWRVAMMMDVL
ncbi:unnamed protein product [Triticum turgidum subsp. durum]|uniref:Photosystem I reaction center subunit II, chloroplastic n=1 Tax=Triticum turgidum subsp. durum TaxID=4567 RepID=A0A9R0U124_TRITD|nr:unnamed protein product [Triticum turgidum subsp. durum]VAI38600.1 unnamed protein product [Triticum turgidum subsp. durum]